MVAVARADSYSCAEGGVIAAGRYRLPAWVPAQKNSIAIMPEANTLSDIQPANSPLNGWSYYRNGAIMWSPSLPKIINDFSGGVYNPYFSPSGGNRGCIVYHGGGHAATNWNGIVVFDLSDLRYYIIMEGCLNCYPGDSTNTEYSDGQPMSPHSYDHLVILGPEAGYPKGALMTPVRHAAAIESYSSSAAHLFDFAHPENKFTRLAGHNSNLSSSIGGGTAYDPGTGRVWWVPPANELWYTPYFDLSTNAFVKKEVSPPLPYCHSDSMFSLFYPGRNLVIVSMSNSARTERTIYYLDSRSASPGWRKAALSNALPVPSSGMGFSMTIDGDGDLLCYSQQILNGYIRISLPAVLTDTWTSITVSTTGDSMVPAYIIGKRWALIPELETIIFKASGETAHRAIRI